MADFVSGLELNRAFYEEVVLPLLGRRPYAAARLGTGSDVLGYDSPRSTDHGWGPALVVFVDHEDVETVSALIDGGLPETFAGRPVRYGWDEFAVTHHVVVTTLAEWLRDHLGVDATQELSPVDWLLVPQQLLLEVTAGAVYHDDGGKLEEVRRRLAWYPDDVWRWLVAAQWRRIAQEEPFVGRTAEAGDELGSCLVAARLARELMRLWFLFSRTYWPYTKWFGSAFARVPGSQPLAAALGAALRAATLAEREAALVDAYRIVAARHSELDLSDPEDPEVRPFYGRPYLVLAADRFAGACLARLDRSPLRALPLVGSVDQAVDSTDVLSRAAVVHRLRRLYTG